ncbi:GGDEF domain protein [Synechococcus sp. PCC 7335]|uniref:diguanylate cyclase domain-containing protein n=1 Tax=Synechococcus sp. (strain ATCC 29403 / PCC 7335) TaxID=91464 RepID=UPI00017ED60D|nr:diguanylate cyclase [Synechococcus sp. PCC 7335]EDX86861.1 GGDEF domain protein [Synechococcus sp. PCC 7335]
MPTIKTSDAAPNVVAWYWPDTSTPKYIDNQSDAADQFTLILQMLMEKGCEVSTKRWLDQVVDAATEQMPDLLLISLQTAGEQGYHLCQELRQRAIAQHLPIVFVGARGSSQELNCALHYGGSDYLQLSMAPEECWLRLKHHLSTAQLVRRLQADQIDLTARIGEYSRILEQQEAVKVSLTQRNQVLQQLALVDGLTQVANRRGFDHNIADRWKEARARGQKISLLLCDIDYFKGYNDIYGHLAGDACLQTVAAALQRGARRQLDQVARYGGEEFAVLLPDTDAEGAQKVALTVQEEIARAQIPHRGSLVKQFLSMSIGISTLRPAQLEHDAFEELIRYADNALYAAKLQGRDRTYFNTAQPRELIAEEPAHPRNQPINYQRSLS